MTHQDVFQACDSGAVWTCSPDELREMLQALTRLSGPNPSPRAKAVQCSALIRQRLDQIAADQRVASSPQNHKNNDGDHWYKKPVGILILTVVGGLLLALIKVLLGI